jgi:hypothetical protein
MSGQQPPPQPQQPGLGARIRQNINMAQQGYEQLIKAIIRPPRAEYSVAQHLGPAEFSFLGQRFVREDVELETNNTTHPGMFPICIYLLSTML